MKRFAASPREAAPGPVCALWTDLLARLTLAAVASSQAQSRQQLRDFGVRRTGTAAMNLVRELSVAHRMAAAAGVFVAPLDLQRRIGELARPGALVWHLRGLEAAYRGILADPSTAPGGLMAEWLAGRLRVHLVQAESIEPGTHRDGPQGRPPRI